MGYRIYKYRLEECLRQMAQAAKVMGSEDLESKFEEALGKVRRITLAACAICRKHSSNRRKTRIKLPS
jgi:hypothetical protein